MRYLSMLGGVLLALAPVGAAAQGFGYETTVDVYLDMAPAEGPAHPAGLRDTNDIRLDFSSAINRPDDDDDGSCDHRRDFVFNCGFYDDLDTTGPGAGTNRWICSAGNNAFRANSFPKNPGHDPVAIDQEGWYTFRHTFQDDGTGVLEVVMDILDDQGVLVKSWTRSDPSDIIGVSVGGNRYGWFATNELAVLAFDNSTRASCLGGGYIQGFESDAAGWQVFGDPAFHAVRVASGTNGIASAGGAWHAEPLEADGIPATDWGGYACAFEGSGLAVDLRPGTDKNHINTNSRQLVPLAFLGTACFDPCAEIDEDTASLRGALPTTKRSCEDVDGDGILDLVLNYRARQIEDPTQAECDDPAATAVVEGKTLSGESFSGSDAVTWLGPACN